MNVVTTGEKRRKVFGLTLRYVVMVALLALFVGPFLWLFSMAIRPMGADVYELTLLVENPTFENFADVWQIYGFARAFLNSVLAVFFIIILNIYICSLAAYPLARINFPGKQIVFIAILATLMIPFQIYMIPLFILMRDLHLIDTLTAVVLPFSVGAFGIFLLRQYYMTIPKDLEEAARIDGAGEFNIWWLVMFPLTKPAVAAMAIFVFVAQWSNFLWPLVVLDSREKWTLPIAIEFLSGGMVERTQYVAAGSVIAVFPVIILFFFLQRYFLGELTLGAVKE